MPAPRRLLYLDSSAVVKRVQLEAESAALAAFVAEQAAQGGAPISSELLRTELGRALWNYGPEPLRLAAALLSDIDQIPITRAILDRAGGLLPGHRLRTLDAIHLASAIGLGDTLVALVSYDARMLDAAAQLGLATSRPS